MYDKKGIFRISFYPFSKIFNIFVIQKKIFFKSSFSVMGRIFLCACVILLQRRCVVVCRYQCRGKKVYTVYRFIAATHPLPVKFVRKLPVKLAYVCLLDKYSVSYQLGYHLVGNKLVFNVGLLQPMLPLPGISSSVPPPLCHIFLPSPAPPRTP